jgi:hypothetical protein
MANNEKETLRIEGKERLQALQVSYPRGTSEFVWNFSHFHAGKHLGEQTFTAAIYGT